MITRTIYIGDIHGRKDIIEFFNLKNDGKTLFILTGDIFDRGKYSFEVFIKIKKLFEEGVLQGVLGNHDLFFIFTHLKNLNLFTYKTQLLGNGGKATIKSFRKNIQYKNNYKHNNLGVGLIEISRWLLKNFNLYYIDNLKNITIHGGIPIFYDGNIVGENLNGKFIYGIDYIHYLNNKLKERDNLTVSKFTGIYNNNKILKNNSQYYKNDYKIDGYIMNVNDYSLFLPTWYRSGEYVNNEILINSITNHLKEKGLNKLILGHDLSLENESILKNTIFRIDKGIGILEIDENNNVIKNYKI